MSLLTPIRLLPMLLAMTAPIVAEDLTGHPTAGEGPIEVKLRCVLIDLQTISGADQSYTANLAYVARWTDARLRHEGPGDKILPLSDIWHPRLQIVNRQRLQESFAAEARVSPEGEVESGQRVWGDFTQPLDLHDFPFDRQELRAELVGIGHAEGTVIFRADPEYPSAVSDRLSITDWEVTGWTAEPGEWTIGSKGKSLPALRLVVAVERNHGYHMVNIILPLTMIICMSWVVFWISPKNINPRISVAVTAMLTLIAYRFAVSASLPKIAYLTRIDWFILGSSVLVFASLLEVITTSWFEEKGGLETACRINRWMRVLAPVAFALVVLGSFY